MDGTRFDTLTRELATRRRLLGALFGLAAGSSALAAAADAGAARRTCRLPGDKCVQGRQCCSGFCETATRRGRIRRCVCPTGLTACRGVCTPLGTMQNCLACGDVCGPDQKCCGARGCVDLGTQTDCLDCDDGCDDSSSDNMQREFCNGDKGCQLPCRAAMGPASGGFVSVDWPPVIFAPPAVGQLWNSYGFYATTDQGAYPPPYVACTSSADCSACPETVGANYPVVGCGCMGVVCGQDGNPAYSLIGSYPPDFVPPGTAVCYAHYVV